MSLSSRAKRKKKSERTLSENEIITSTCRQRDVLDRELTLCVNDKISKSSIRGGIFNLLINQKYLPV